MKKTTLFKIKSTGKAKSTENNSTNSGARKMYNIIAEFDKI